MIKQSNWLKTCLLITRRKIQNISQHNRNNNNIMSDTCSSDFEFFLSQVTPHWNTNTKEELDYTLLYIMKKWILLRSFTNTISNKNKNYTIILHYCASSLQTVFVCLNWWRKICCFSAYYYILCTWLCMHCSQGSLEN